MRKILYLLISSVCLFISGCTQSTTTPIESTHASAESIRPRFKQQALSVFAEIDRDYKSNIDCDRQIIVAPNELLDIDNQYANSKESDVVFILNDLIRYELQHDDGKYMDTRQQLVTIIGEPANFNAIPSTNTSQNREIDIQTNKILNVAGMIIINLIVYNNSDQTIFVSPLDFTVSSDSDTKNPTNESYNTFQGVNLQKGQQVEGRLYFSVLDAQQYTTLNYNGDAGSQQIHLTIPTN